MPRCLFCPTEGNALTDEHVFPAALGGNLVVKNSVCKACNNGFSEAFEEDIVKRFEHVRHIFRIPDRRGNVPDIDTKVELQGEQLDARLMGNGTLKLKPIFTKEVRNGVEERVARYVSDRQEEDLRKSGWEMAETTSGGEVQGFFSGRLDFINLPGMLRLATKIAYLALVFRMGKVFASSSAFEQTRSYVRTGTGATRARLFLNEGFLGVCPQGPHLHSVVLVGQNNKRSVDAIVRIFGGLCYFVNLYECYVGADFSNTLVFDAHRGEIVGALLTHLQGEFLQVNYVTENKETIWNDRVKSGEWFTRFIDRALQPKTDT